MFVLQDLETGLYQRSSDMYRLFVDEQDHPLYGFYGAYMCDPNHSTYSVYSQIMTFDDFLAADGMLSNFLDRGRNVRIVELKEV